LLLLGLQLLGLPLSLLQQVLYFAPIAGRAQRHADGLRQEAQQIDLGLGQRTEETELRDSDAHAIGLERSQDQVPRSALAQTRADREVVVRYVLQVQQAAVLE